MKRYGPAELAMIQYVFSSIPEEMGAMLARTAYSPNIKERLDFSCAIFDRSGALLAQAAHIPVHLGAMPRSVAAVLETFPDLGAGDVALLNDPFAGGSHLPDLTTVSPLGEADGTVTGFAATRAHHADVGGMTPGSLPPSRTIHQEGLRIPPVRLVRGGRVDEDVMNLLCANSRNPEERRGDMRAQLQAHRLAERRWGDRLRRYGAEDVREMGRALMEYAERRMRVVLETLPDGEWEAEDVLEVQGRTVLRGRLQVRAGRVRFDFRDSDDAVDASLNAVRAIVESAVQYVLLCLLAEASGEDSPPVNAGCFRNLTVCTRPGSVLDAGWPHAVAGGNVETSQRVVDLTLRLMEHALPGRMPAQSQGTMNNVTLGGLGEDGRPYAYYETLGGGAGAASTGPGASAVQVHMTNTRNTPVEAVEFSTPLQVTELAIREGSGGTGRHRGGDGLIRTWRACLPVEATLLTERREVAPEGVAGGGAGRPGGQHRIGIDGAWEEVPAKGSLRLRPGESLRVETPGGGGWGGEEFH